MIRISDLYIKGRDRILKRVFYRRTSPALNHLESRPTGIQGPGSIGEDLKRALNQLKGKAISRDGRSVNYSKLAGSMEYQHYRSLTLLLNSFDYRELPSLAEQLAFWINLYNALVIDAVIQQGVRNSVTETRLGVVGFFQRAAYLVNGQRFSLTDIEHGVLRANLGFPYFPSPHFSTGDPRQEAVIRPLDPRIHFALNCASNSCPPIGVYTPGNINQQLNLAASSFVKGDTVVDQDHKVLSVSKIFNWYAGDFGGRLGVLQFLAEHLGLPREQLQGVRLVFHPYDWGLNKTRLEP